MPTLLRRRTAVAAGEGRQRLPRGLSCLKPKQGHQGQQGHQGHRGREGSAGILRVLCVLGVLAVLDVLKAVSKTLTAKRSGESLQ
jgi:hypothetical protein